MNIIRRYANFTAFLVVTAVVTAVLVPAVHPAKALLIGFDCGAAGFLVLLIILFRSCDAGMMRARAAGNEPDHQTLVAIAMIIVAVVLTALWVELTGSAGKHAGGIGLAALTLALAWLFANSLFALHYAHVWYLADGQGQDRAGLDFPGTDKTPDYWDFAYFAFVLGMTFQVSDVQVSSQHMRRLALGHGLIAFAFNIIVVALSVSLVASVLGG